MIGGYTGSFIKKMVRDEKQGIPETFILDTSRHYIDLLPPTPHRPPPYKSLTPM